MDNKIKLISQENLNQILDIAVDKIAASCDKYLDDIEEFCGHNNDEYIGAYRTATNEAIKIIRIIQNTVGDMQFATNDDIINLANLFNGIR